MIPRCPRISFDIAAYDEWTLRDGIRPRLFYRRINPMSSFDTTRAVVNPV